MKILATREYEGYKRYDEINLSTKCDYVITLKPEDLGYTDTVEALDNIGKFSEPQKAKVDMIISGVAVFDALAIEVLKDGSARFYFMQAGGAEEINLTVN